MKQSLIVVGVVLCCGAASLSFAQAPTGSVIMKITSTCPSGTSATATPPTCFLPDSYQVEKLVGTVWTKEALLTPPTGSMVVPTTYTFSNLPIPSTLTSRAVPLLYGVPGKPSPGVTTTLAKTNVDVTVSVTATVPVP